MAASSSQCPLSSRAQAMVTLNVQWMVTQASHFKVATHFQPRKSKWLSHRPWQQAQSLASTSVRSRTQWAPDRTRTSQSPPLTPLDSSSSQSRPSLTAHSDYAAWLQTYSLTFKWHQTAIESVKGTLLWASHSLCLLTFRARATSQAVWLSWTFRRSGIKLTQMRSCSISTSWDVNESS